jgi:DNA polymerase-1
MLGQSYGLLNSRAANEVFNIWGEHEEIYPIAQIHDAQYYIVKDDPELLYNFCNTLKQAVSWDELPELQQDTIELSGTPQISFDSWANLQDIEFECFEDFTKQYNLLKGKKYSTLP